jgi:hypothetical protein
LTYVRSNGAWLRVPVDEYGLFVAYPGLPAVLYDEAHETVVTQQDRPLPPLLQRALALASGQLPTYCTFEAGSGAGGPDLGVGIAWPAVTSNLAHAVAAGIGQSTPVPVTLRVGEDDV